VDRRRAHDFRSLEEKSRQGERRSGLDRRSREKRKSEELSVIGRNLRYVVICAFVFCFVDIRYFDGRHSTQVAIEWGERADHLAARWVGGGFPQ
jgi:hypothetical protein